MKKFLFRKKVGQKKTFFKKSFEKFKIELIIYFLINNIFVETFIKKFMPVSIYKPIGQTPNELVEIYKKENKHAIKVSFTGRLDPMARGSMILLVNEECKLHDKYIAHNKTYEFQVLFGFRTDTYDVLGILNAYNNPSKFKQIDAINIDKYVGKTKQEYPPYSSIVVNKKPLWEWSKLGLIDSIKPLPSKTVEIYEFEEIPYDSPIDSYEKLHEKIKTMIYSLSEINQPKFRVPEIDSMWNIYFESYKQQLVNCKPIIKKYRAKVSSGTYIRSISSQIGNEIGCGAIALDIHRTHIFDN
jgi:tRNA pseudouridine(55) synthase